MAKKEFTHRIMFLENGERTTVHESEVEKFRAKGYKFGAKTRGAAKWDIEEGECIEKYGKAYIDTPGDYQGQVAMVNKEGRTHAAKQKDVEHFMKAGHKLGDKKNLQL